MHSSVRELAPEAEDTRTDGLVPEAISFRKCAPVSHEQFWAVLDLLPIAVLVSTDRSCEVIRANAAGRELLRSRPGQNLSLTAPEGAGCAFYRDGAPLPPDQLPLRKAAATGRPVPDFDCELRFPDGAARTITGRATPVFDARGEVCASVGAFIDISRRVTVEDQNRLLLDELGHRVKNTVSIIQAISRQTLRPLLPDKAFRAYEQRLVSLAKAHDLLFRKSALTASVPDVVRAAVSPIAGEALSRIRTQGPELDLEPQAALSLSMILHELGTNACKYGALSQAGGKLDISWRLERRGRDCVLALRWRESDGPPVSPPSRTGFGTKLLDISVKGLSGGSVKVSYAPEGVICDIALPCAEAVAGAPARRAH